MTPAAATVTGLNARAVVRPARQRLTPADLAVGRRTAAAYCAATDRAGVLDNLDAVSNPIAVKQIKNGRCPSLAERGETALARVATQLVALANAGVTEAECLELPHCLIALVHDLYAGTAREDVTALREQNARVDAAETVAETATVVAGVRGDVQAYAAYCAAEADARQRRIAVDTAFARALRAEAHRVQTTGVLVAPRAATLAAMGGTR